MQGIVASLLKSDVRRVACSPVRRWHGRDGAWMGPPLEELLATRDTLLALA